MRRAHQTKGVALVIVLSLVVIVSLILVAFVTTMWMDRTASSSYGQSLAADQIGQGAVNLVVAELRNEMGKDALPDLTYPLRPLFTNVTSTNILPERVGTNSAMPNLIKTSVASNSFNGGRVNGLLMASTNSTAQPSKNGRYMDVSRWSAPYLGTFPNTASLPNWVIMTRGGATNTGTFGLTGDTLNNPATGNTNYAIGRFAYAIYDVGGLLDITVAGHPTSLSVAQINQLKGTLAGVDLTAVGITGSKIDELVNWRNAASASDYMRYVTNTAATNGFSRIASGDNTFLGRQDLIKAAKENVAGLNTNSLTNFTTFSREKNAPSWGPQSKVGTPLGNTINYAGLSTNLNSGTNFLVPYVRHKTPATIKTYQIDGSQTDYPVVAGDPVVSRRFPLDRIKWIGPNGPQNGGTTESIQACFGLLWNEASGVWRYVGATGVVEQTDIKTLAQIEVEKREPNFFELLKAGILSGSLALEGNTSAGALANSFNYVTTHEKSLPLHVFRIGASILSQYEASSFPIVVEYQQSGAAWQACGIDNVPYLNMFHCLAGGNSANSMGVYLMFGLWNPHQGGTTGRPDIRLRVQGGITLQNDYARNIYKPAILLVGNTPNAHAGYSRVLNATADLSTSVDNGVNGFTDPHALLPNDLSPSPGVGSSAGMMWAELPSINNVRYAGLRLPDFIIDPTDKFDTTTIAADVGWWTNLQFIANTNSAQPFNVWLEFKNPAGDWIPYNYHAGINDPVTWFAKMGRFACSYMGPPTKKIDPPPIDPTAPTTEGLEAVMQPIDPPAGVSNSYYRQYVWETTDPRSLRFNYTQYANTGVDQTTPAWSSYLRSSIWSEATESGRRAFGRHGNQIFQKIFGANWFHAGLSRNNAKPPTGNPPVASTTAGSAYVDADGVQRMADSGLFTSTPQTSGWEGNPYAVSTTRVADRPIILNRPFYSVGELGYVNRDYPWRTLDFFSENSADGGLLDIFTMNQSNESFQRGKVSLNAQNPEVMEAVLKNTFADIMGNMPVTYPTKIASTLVGLTKPGTGTPLANKADIPSQIVSKLTSYDFGGTDEQNIKARRESVTRALADVTQTRTWNLLIDVVAQSGKYSPTATATDQFVVEGERRFWLHVAIDRITGEIVDQQLEPVTQ